MAAPNQVLNVFTVIGELISRDARLSPIILLVCDGECYASGDYSAIHMMKIQSY